MARKTKEEAEKTFHALLEAAAILFTKQGVATTTLNEIAKEAGLTRGAVYWHFQGKDDIIRALWETYTMPKIEPLDERMLALKAQNAFQDFKAITDDILTLISEDRQVGQAMRIVLHNVELTDNKSDLQDFLQSEKQKFENALIHSFTMISENNTFRDGLNADISALCFLTFIHGLLGQHFDPEDRFDITTHGQTFMNIFFNGVIAEAP